MSPREIADCLARLRTRRPLVHHITNLVTAYDVAAVTLALGGSPVMAIAPEEVEAVAGGAGALALNLGTLTSAAVEAMRLAGRSANRSGVPVVLDPVGAGATEFRTAQAHRLLEEIRMACVRGNVGEVAALAGRGGLVRGVESLDRGEDPAPWAEAVARRTGAVVAATGPVDVVTDGQRTVRVLNGHPLLGRIPGSGCMATAAVAAFLAVEPERLQGTVAALVCFGVAAEVAAEAHGGPGSFRATLLDAVAALDGPVIEARALVEA